MKQDKSGFWKSICADPDDDVPRLVFADYLDEHGQPERAELIRAQCDLETLPLSDPRRLDLEMTARRLLHEHYEEWVEELPKWVNRQTVTFRRGFPYGIRVTSSAYHRHCSAMAKRTVIQQLALRDRFWHAGAHERIETVGQLERLRVLNSSIGMDSELEWFLPRLTGIQELTLDSPCGVNVPSPADKFRALLASTPMTQVRQLNLKTSHFNSTTGRRVFRELTSVDWPHLKHLGLFEGDYYHGAIDSTLLDNLIETYSACEIESLALQPFAQGLGLAPLLRLEQLQSLNLRITSASGIIADLLDVVPQLKNLSRLSIREVPDTETHSLPELANLEQLHDLTLTTTWRQEGINDLAASGRASHLLRLGVGMCNSPFDLTSFAKVARLPRLRYLILPDSISTPNLEGLKALADSPHLPDLKMVVFGYSVTQELFQEQQEQFPDRFQIIQELL